MLLIKTVLSTNVPVSSGLMILVQKALSIPMGIITSRLATTPGTGKPKECSVRVITWVVY